VNRSWLKIDVLLAAIANPHAGDAFASIPVVGDLERASDIPELLHRIGDWFSLGDSAKAIERHRLLRSWNLVQG
jgi:hypothetical protein